MYILSITHTRHPSFPRRENALARKERNRKTTKLKFCFQEKSSLVSSTFSWPLHSPGWPSRTRLWWNTQIKPWGGWYLGDCWEAWDPLPLLSEEVNRRWQGALRSCPPRQFHSQLQKLSSQECVFSARSWLFASNADICVKYTKPFQLLKSYQLLHAWFEQNRSCST